MDIDALRIELTTDPLGRGYAGMSDQAAADDLNTEYRFDDRLVTVEAVRLYLITEIDGTGVQQRSTIDMIREYFEDGTVRGAAGTESAPEARRSGAGVIIFMLGLASPNTYFPIEDPSMVAQFEALGPDGGQGPNVLTNAQLLGIQELARVSRAVEIDLGARVEAGHVEEARRG